MSRISSWIILSNFPETVAFLTENRNFIEFYRTSLCDEY